MLVSFIVQYLGLKFIHFSTLAFNGIMATIGIREGIFVVVFLQLFTGSLLAAAYGIWVVPYLHQGQRSQLTFALPVVRWKYPLAYGMSMMVLLLLQELVALFCYGLVFGFGGFLADTFYWRAFFLSFLLEMVAFEMVMFGFAVSSLSLGQIPTFFLGMVCVFLLQMGGIIFHIEWERYLEIEAPWYHWSRYIYERLPPVGELIFELRNNFKTGSFSENHLALWGVWLVIFVIFFYLKLRYPPLSQTTEP